MKKLINQNKQKKLINLKRINKKIFLVILLTLIIFLTGCDKYIQNELDNNQNLTGTSGVNNKTSNKNASGMANLAERAYAERWNYTWGSATPGNVDNSGLIFSYVGTGLRTTEDMLSSSNNSGDISTIPDIPGLGVHMPGHLGVYGGNGMVIEAKNEENGIVRANISSSPWSKWFEITGVEYSK